MTNSLDATLWPHPAAGALCVQAVRVRLDRRRADGIALRFEIDAPAGSLVLPPPAPPLRANHLWETTCFEMFLRPAGESGYLEFNFSPSGRWAVYAFDAYRAGRVAAPAASPTMELDTRAEGIAADIVLALDLPAPAYEVGLCAVVEERGFGKSYWALSHGAPAPDFHHRSCFAEELPPPPGA
jgi:hypothetical protein